MLSYTILKSTKLYYNAIYNNMLYYDIVCSPEHHEQDDHGVDAHEDIELLRREP